MAVYANFAACVDVVGFSGCAAGIESSGRTGGDGSMSYFDLSDVTRKPAAQPCTRLSECHTAGLVASFRDGGFVMRIFYLASVAAVACLLSGSASWGQTSAGYQSASNWSARSAAYSHQSQLWQGHHSAGCGCDKTPDWTSHCDVKPPCCKPCFPRVIPLVLNGIGNTLDKIFICGDCCQPTCCDKPVKTCCAPAKPCCAPAKPCCSKPTSHIWSCDKGCAPKGCGCDHHGGSRAIPQPITPPSPFLDEELPPAPPKDTRRAYPNWSTPSANRSNTPTPARVTEASSHKTAAQSPTSGAPQRLSVNEDMFKLLRKDAPETRDASMIRRTSAESDVRESDARSTVPVNPLRK
jgi:hypothetical protein